MTRTLVARLHNPRNLTCACDPDCWCNRTGLGRAVKWWFPARYFGLTHKNRALEEWKLGQPEGALESWKHAQAMLKKQVTPAVVGAEPIFTVTDVDRSLEHYRLLGFSIAHHDETYAFARRDNLTIHLAQAAVSHPATLYMHVTDADGLAAEWREAGVEVVGPQDFDYGKREGSVVDPDGNRIRFGSPLRER